MSRSSSARRRHGTRRSVSADLSKFVNLDIKGSESLQNSINILNRVIRNHKHSHEDTSSAVKMVRHSAKKVYALPSSTPTVKQTVVNFETAALTLDQLTREVALTEKALMQVVDNAKRAIAQGGDPTPYQEEIEVAQGLLAEQIAAAQKAAGAVAATETAVDEMPQPAEADTYLARLKKGVKNIYYKHGKTIAAATLMTAGAAVAYYNRGAIGNYAGDAAARLRAQAGNAYGAGVGYAGDAAALLRAQAANAYGAGVGYAGDAAAQLRAQAANAYGAGLGYAADGMHAGLDRVYGAAPQVKQGWADWALRREVQGPSVLDRIVGPAQLQQQGWGDWAMGKAPAEGPSAAQRIWGKITALRTAKTTGGRKHRTRRAIKF